MDANLQALERRVRAGKDPADLVRLIRERTRAGTGTLYEFLPMIVELRRNRSVRAAVDEAGLLDARLYSRELETHNLERDGRIFMPAHIALFQGLMNDYHESGLDRIFTLAEYVVTGGERASAKPYAILRSPLPATEEPTDLMQKSDKELSETNIETLFRYTPGAQHITPERTVELLFGPLLDTARTIFGRNRQRIEVFCNIRDAVYLGGETCAHIGLDWINHYQAEDQTIAAGLTLLDDDEERRTLVMGITKRTHNMLSEPKYQI